MILHLTSKSEWEKAQEDGEYRCASLYTEGFIHFSSVGQIVHVANGLYRNLPDPIVLVVNPAILGGSLKWEGEGGLSFPHLYRSLFVSEVAEVVKWNPNQNNEYSLTEELKKAVKYLKLETDRLVLREFELQDAEAVQSYGSDEELVKYMPWGPNDRKATYEFLCRNFKAQSENERIAFDFAIIEKASGRLIGGAGIFVRPGASQTGYIGYIFERASHGKGYATEVSKRLLEFGFGNLKLNRIEATCDSENAASFRVMERLGMQREGLLRQNLFTKGRWRSTYLYAILKSEFTAN